MAIILFIWIILSVYGVKRRTEESDILSMHQDLALRGICALEIMIGHIGVLTNHPVLYFNRKAGILFVGFFLMMSGYGLEYGVDNKKGYMKGFIRKKVIRLFLPACFIHYIYEIIMCLFFYEGNNISVFSIKNFISLLNWYVFEQLVLYVVFFILYKITPKWSKFIIFVLSLFFIMVAYYAGWYEPIYGSVLCFSMGLYLYRYKNMIYAVIEKHYIAALLGTGIVLLCSVAGFVVLGTESVIGNPVCRNLAAMSFCALIIVILNRYEIGNRITYRLGQCSYELFLIHFFVMSVLVQFHIASSVILGLLTIVLSVVGAMMVNKLAGLIYKKS